MTDLTLDDFDFALPQELIAQNPVFPKQKSKMLLIKQNQLTDCTIKDLPNIINHNDLIIVNNTKVIKSRLLATKNTQLFTITLHKQNPADTTGFIWWALCNKSKKLKIKDELNSAEATIEVLAKKPSGEILVKFHNINNIYSFLESNGFMPLPPYIKRTNVNNDHDLQDYQTIFAKKHGAVASPTASLHFDSEMIKTLKKQNILMSEITLHVGAGTFLPVKEHYIKNHIMHSEYGEVPGHTIELIKKTKASGGRVIAVGTTVTRILEYVFNTPSSWNDNKTFQGEVDIFMYPGFKFNVVDIMLTNFHTPKSTLLMLVSAFAGTENIKKAYAHAIAKRYRFFSYGDCSLIYKNQ